MAAHEPQASMRRATANEDGIPLFLQNFGPNDFAASWNSSVLDYVDTLMPMDSPMVRVHEFYCWIPSHACS
jgi:hypothetical protein